MKKYKEGKSVIDKNRRKRKNRIRKCISNWERWKCKEDERLTLSLPTWGIYDQTKTDQDSRLRTNLPTRSPADIWLQGHKNTAVKVNWWGTTYKLLNHILKYIQSGLIHPSTPRLWCSAICFIQALTEMNGHTMCKLTKNSMWGFNFVRRYEHNNESRYTCRQNYNNDNSFTRR